MRFPLAAMVGKAYGNIYEKRKQLSHQIVVSKTLSLQLGMAETENYAVSEVRQKSLGYFIRSNNTPTSTFLPFGTKEPSVAWHLSGATSY